MAKIVSDTMLVPVFHRNFGGIEHFDFETDRADHGIYIRWYLKTRYAHMEIIRYFDLLKTFGYFDRVVKFD